MRLGERCGVVVVVEREESEEEKEGNERDESA